MKSTLIAAIALFCAIANAQPTNPCVKAGGSCDPIIPGFCQGEFDSKVNLPCGPKGIVGVGCCRHANAQPSNPCVKAGGSCDPIIPGFCQGEFDTKVNLSCGPKGIVGVGCCRHTSSE